MSSPVDSRTEIADAVTRAQLCLAALRTSTASPMAAVSLGYHVTTTVLLETIRRADPAHADALAAWIADGDAAEYVACWADELAAGHALTLPVDTGAAPELGYYGLLAALRTAAGLPGADVEELLEYVAEQTASMLRAYDPAARYSDGSDGHDPGTRIWAAGDPEPDRPTVWDDCGYSWINHGDGAWVRETPARRLFGRGPRFLGRMWPRLLAQYGPVADQPRRP